MKIKTPKNQRTQKPEPRNQKPKPKNKPNTGRIYFVF